MASSYGAFHIIFILSPLIICGWIVLAIGAYLARVLGILQSIALGLMAMLMLGVLKGSTIVSVIATAGLCVALIPLGVKIILDNPRPNTFTIVKWCLFLLGLVIILYFLGQAG